jgi:hypothetical protein
MVTVVVDWVHEIGLSSDWSSAVYWALYVSPDMAADGNPYRATLKFNCR